jgi:cysteine synthase
VIPIEVTAVDTLSAKLPTRAVRAAFRPPTAFFGLGTGGVTTGVSRGLDKDSELSSVMSDPAEEKLQLDHMYTWEKSNAKNL